MPSKIPPFTIRLNDITKQKLQYIADTEQRSINKEILYLIEEEIKRYEKINGAIRIEKREEIKNTKNNIETLINSGNVIVGDNSTINM